MRAPLRLTFWCYQKSFLIRDVVEKDMCLIKKDALKLEPLQPLSLFTCQNRISSCI
jgi:hypothetical protein